ncbi:MAG: SH3 domain-containing protein [Candidatus Flexifilum sp.]
MKRRITAGRALWAWIAAAVLLLGGLGAQAQGAALPINVGDNQTGAITAGAAAVSYALTVNAPQNVNVQVFAITVGFQPALLILDPTGIALAQVNSTGTSAAAVVSLSTVGTYSIIVGTANGQPGQFLISVQPGGPIVPPVPLQAGIPQTGQVSATDPLRAFSFSGIAADSLIVTVTTTTVPTGATGGPVVRLKDALTGQTLALSGARLTQASFRVPPAAGMAANYIVEVAHGGSPGAEMFSICMAGQTTGLPCPAVSGTGQVVIVPTTAPQIPPTPVPTQFRPVSIPANGPCSVASSQGAAINVRSGPSTSFPAIAQLPNNQVALVIGRLPDGSWYQVNYSGLTGWISGSVVIVGGLCGSIPNVTPTPIPPNVTVTLIPSLTPSPTATTAPTATLTPVPAATLNFSLPPNYGSTALTAGFLPDPFAVGITSGGPVNVSYLGGICRGFATSAPDFSVNYTAGASSLLRFYFIGNGDSTLIINGPNGTYFCNDDSFGTLNPTIDFNNPTSGRYDIWIGSYSSGTFIPGTLYVTEINGNHP